MTSMNYDKSGSGSYAGLNGGYKGNGSGNFGGEEVTSEQAILFNTFAQRGNPLVNMRPRNKTSIEFMLNFNSAVHYNPNYCVVEKSKHEHEQNLNNGAYFSEETHRKMNYHANDETKFTHGAVEALNEKYYSQHKTRERDQYYKAAFPDGTKSDLFGVRNRQVSWA